MQHINVLTLFISKIPKNEETSSQIRRTNFKMLFQLQNLSKTALFVVFLQRYEQEWKLLFVMHMSYYVLVILLINIPICIWFTIESIIYNIVTISCNILGICTGIFTIVRTIIIIKVDIPIFKSGRVI